MLFYATNKPSVDSLVVCRKAELQRRAGKYTLPYFRVQRAKMILLVAKGLNNDEIAACLTAAVRWSAAGGSGSLPIVSRDWESKRVPGRPRTLSPRPVVQVKARACELPATHDLRCLAGVAIMRSRTRTE